ncbi:MAG: YARHG domain-containing protein [Eggerthellaceae bacterium]|nr:YARHG domain-containing protein [Eggerthellaceae bacterium]
MKCQNCGADIPEGSRFCVNCGARLTPQQTPSTEDESSEGKASSNDSDKTTILNPDDINSGDSAKTTVINPVTVSSGDNDKTTVLNATAPAAEKSDKTTVLNPEAAGPNDSDKTSLLNPEASSPLDSEKTTVLNPENAEALDSDKTHVLSENAQQGSSPQSTSWEDITSQVNSNVGDSGYRSPVHYQPYQEPQQYVQQQQQYNQQQPYNQQNVQYIDPNDPALYPNDMKRTGRSKTFMVVAIIVIVILVIALVFSLLFIFGYIGPSTDTEDIDVSGTENPDYVNDLEYLENANEGYTGTLTQIDPSELGLDDDVILYEDDNGNYYVATPDNTIEPSSAEESSSSSSSSSASSSTSNDTSNGTVSTQSTYILPDSNTRDYTESELNQLSDYELYLARNEIYARHGRGFNSEDLQNYFDNQDWYIYQYSPEEFDYLENETGQEFLNQYEKDNVNAIMNIEAERNSPYAA